MSHDPRFQHASTGDVLPARLSDAIPPGRVTLTQRMARGTAPRTPSTVALDPVALVQRHRIQDIGMAEAMGFPAESVSIVQRHGDAHTGLADHDVRAIAAQGVSGSGTALPHLDIIQRSFGAHDVSGVRAHVGGAAAQASEALGADAYATGSQVAFRESPSLFIAAHEAAHVVQQRSGVHFSGAVGQAGDAYEQHADAVAARVVAGESAEDLLRGGAGGGGSALVQRKEKLCMNPRTFQAEQCGPDPAMEGVHAKPLPPEPIDWSKTPGRPPHPGVAHSFFESPRYDPLVRTVELAPFRAAFDASWSELQHANVATIRMDEPYQAQKKQTTQLLAIAGDAVVKAGTSGGNATDAFKGDALTDGASRVDADKLSVSDRTAIVAKREKIEELRRGVTKKAAAIDGCAGTVSSKSNLALIAINELEIVQVDREVADENLKGAQVKRDLEDFKARSKAAVEGLKAATSIVEALADPTKLASNLAKAVAQTGAFDGAVADEKATERANAALSEIDQSIAILAHRKASLASLNGVLKYQNCLTELKAANSALAMAMGDLLDAKAAYGAAYRELAALMAAAAKASNLSVKDQSALAGAVEVMPKIEHILQTIDAMDDAVAIPTYTTDSGVGAALAQNLDSFTSTLGLVKGTKAYIAEQRRLWRARQASVDAAIGSASDTGASDW